MSSFRTMRVPEQVADATASFQGTPMARASGSEGVAEDRSRLRPGRRPGRRCVPRSRFSERDEREERDEHGGDVEREVQALARAAGGGADDVRVRARDVELDGARGLGRRRSRARTSWRAGSCPGAVMITAASRCLRLDAERDVGGHDPAADVGHARRSSRTSARTASSC